MTDDYQRRLDAMRLAVAIREPGMDALHVVADAVLIEEWLRKGEMSILPRHWPDAPVDPKARR